MITCPLCSFENLDGADECERCESSLSELSKPEPHSEEERHILRDRIYVLGPRKPLVVGPETHVNEVLPLLVKNSVGCVLVMKNDDLLGIFTERDALLRLNEHAEELSDRPISQFMTCNPQTLEITDRIAFALHKMDVGGYRHIPVLTDGRVTGIISVRHILRYISDQMLATSA